jgi:Flp pilus assembly protein TadG
MLENFARDMDRAGRRAGYRPFFAPAEQAVAAMEFGLLAPVMALILVGVFDISRVTILWEQAQNASRSIAESASTLAIPTTPGGTNELTWQNANLALSAIFAEIPWLADGIATPTGTTKTNPGGGNFVAVLTSVNYVVPTSGCQSLTAYCCPMSNGDSYCAIVVWSKAYVNPRFTSTGVTRTCNTTLLQKPPGTPYNPLTISTQTVGSGLAGAGITVPDPFFVADVKFTYTPFFFNFITGTITLSSSSYVPVRTSDPGAQNQFAFLLDEGDPAANSAAVCNLSTPPPS